MLRKQKNSKKQGDVGVGYAISYFVKKGITISIPISDSQDYDIVIDDKGLKKVQVKTTYHKNPQGRFVVELRTRTHSKGKVYGVKSLGDIDLLFILTEEGKQYLILKKDIKSKSILTLTSKMDKFII